MSNNAVCMMVLSMGLLWGGLLLAMIHLARHPDQAP